VSIQDALVILTASSLLPEERGGVSMARAVKVGKVGCVCVRVCVCVCVCV
jgi:hypothetical protein